MSLRPSCAAEAAGARRGAFTGGAVTQWELENKGLKAGPGGRSSVRLAQCTRSLDRTEAISAVSCVSSFALSYVTDGLRCTSGSQQSGLVATVFGCSGFLARYVVNSLARQGSQVTAGRVYHCSCLLLARHAELSQHRHQLSRAAHAMQRGYVCNFGCP